MAIVPSVNEVENGVMTKFVFEVLLGLIHTSASIYVICITIKRDSVNEYDIIIYRLKQITCIWITICGKALLSNVWLNLSVLHSRIARKNVRKGVVDEME